jgi:hypothetical protein
MARSSLFAQVFRYPVISSLLKYRRESLVLTGLAVVQVGLVYAHLPGWPCPFKAVSGIPCPTCGLSTASAQLLRGDFREAVNTHAFAPVLLAGMLIFVIVSLLPEAPRQRLVQCIQALEQRTGLAAWILCGLFFYWGLRLLHMI